MTFFARRVLPLVGLAMVLGFSIQRLAIDDTASDMWFHLRIGHEFLSGWSIRRPGHLGVFDSADWTPTQWLPQMGMAATERAFGLAGVVWATGAVHVALILLVYVISRREAAPLPAVITTALAFMAFSIGLSPRPQVLSYVLILVVVSAWLRSERDGRVRWWLIAVAWVWAPLHGMWPLAALIGTVCVVGIALNRSFDRRTLAKMAAVPALSAVVPALTPLGLDLYRAVLLVGGRSEYFREWGPTDFHKPYAVVLAIMLSIAVLHLTRTRQSWLSILLVLMAAGWAVYSIRTTPVAAAVLVPLVARALQSVVPAGAGMTRPERVAVAGLGVAALGALALVAAPRAKDAVVPAWTDQRLSALPAGARVLDDWANGPYFLWKHPELSLVMHGYGDVFTDDEIERNRDIVTLSPRWDVQVDELDVDAALVETDTPLGWALRHDDRWTVVQEDDEFVFLVPAD